VDNLLKWVSAIHIAYRRQLLLLDNTVRFMAEGAMYVKMEVPNLIQPFTFIAVNQVK